MTRSNLLSPPRIHGRVPRPDEGSAAQQSNCVSLSPTRDPPPPKKTAMTDQVPDDEPSRCLSGPVPELQAELMWAPIPCHASNSSKRRKSSVCVPAYVTMCSVFGTLHSNIVIGLPRPRIAISVARPEAAAPGSSCWRSRGGSAAASSPSNKEARNHDQSAVHAACHPDREATRQSVQSASN